MDQDIVRLKVKLKTLAQEARIIRSEEHKALRHGRWGKAHEDPKARVEGYTTYRTLHAHRVFDLRHEARISLILYAYLRRKPCPEHKDSLNLNLRLEQAAAMGVRFGMGTLTNAERRVYLRAWAGLTTPVPEGWKGSES